MSSHEPHSTAKINEIFFSIQGESLTVGCPTVFVRLTGCPLRCVYCDTAYAFSRGQRMTLDEILHQVNAYSCSHVCVTGGEPLAQKSCFPLLTRLADAGKFVSLETSGSMSIREVDPRVMIVMDLKTPASGEEDKNLWDNCEYLKPSDQIKFVLVDRSDYDWAKSMVQQHDLAKRCSILFSPSWQQLDATMLAEWILHDQLPVRMQIQLHKVLWQDEPGR